jgi:hypothetical protein
VLAVPIVVFVGAMLAGRYGTLLYGWLTEPRLRTFSTESSASSTSPQTTERSSTASVMPTEEPTAYEEQTTAYKEGTTALEETTAFQAPKGTPTSSTARIVCFRAEQGASPPLMSTEALNGDVLTRVLTPKVAAHPDGVHIQFDNRLGEDTNYEADDGVVVGITEEGISNHVEQFPPGIVEIKCDPPIGTYDPATIRYARFEVVVGDSGYKSLELECKPGAEPRFSSFIASGADSKFELVSYRDPLEEAREYYKKGLKESDVVEAAGYPKDPNPTVRVVRKRKVIATVWFSTMEMYATYCSGQI